MEKCALLIGFVCLRSDELAANGREVGINFDRFLIKLKLIISSHLSGGGVPVQIAGSNSLVIRDFSSRAFNFN